MRKAFIVARNEYVSAVSSKAFIVGVLLMPVFMGGALAVQYLARDQVDVSDRRFAVVDRTGQLYSEIAARAEERNQAVFKETPETGAQVQVRPKFIPELYSPDASDEVRVDVSLSERVRRKELSGFLVIGEGVFLPGGDDSTLVYHTQTPSFTELPDWLERTVNTEVQQRRMKTLGVDPEVFRSVTGRVPLRRYGLVKAEAGQVPNAQEENRILTFAVPFGGMMLMFMMVMTVAPTMLNNVLEEKMQKISEFLVSSVTPFQLMLGKLLGGVAVAATLSVIYLGAAYGLARHYEFDDRIPLTLYLWFALFILLALVIFGSMFSAIGAACSEIRDAQGLMTPIMLMVIIPMLCLGPVFQSPSSTFSRLVSLFPPATPMLMFVRIAIPPGPPVWEICLGLFLAIGFAVCCVWAAGKIFRIGILSQGQPATLGKLLQWIVSKP